MTLVVKEGETWRGVAVHRAVIMPLCTFLREIEMDVMKEDPVVILPDVSLELLESLIRLVYKGFAPFSEVVTVENLLVDENVRTEDASREADGHDGEG